MTITITNKIFNTDKLISCILDENSDVGAAVCFNGFVREFSNNKHLDYMFVEHYPEMTEKSLYAIEAEAKKRWEINDVLITHRVGKIYPKDLIVSVIVASKHRNNAFQACNFIIDFLKTDAPFWKKEVSNDGSFWVNDRAEDHEKKEKWSSI